MNLDIVNDNTKLNLISKVFETYKDITINKEIQLTERILKRESAIVEVNRNQTIKEMYMYSMDKSSEEKKDILRIIGELLLKGEVDNDKLSAVGLLLEFRKLNSLEYMNIKSQPILNVAQQVLES